MADTLKAEGNKAFSEKNFDEAMCVVILPWMFMVLIGLI